jgi:hypothetical protein
MTSYNTFQDMRGSTIRSLAFAVAALLVPVAAYGNSPAVRATTVPAADCVVTRGPASGVWAGGYYFLNRPGDLNIACPLSLSNRRPSGTGTNKLSKFRIHYRDPDGRGDNAHINVFLIRQTVPATPGALTSVFLCEFVSNEKGSQSTSFARTTVACNEELRAGALYHFEIELQRADFGDEGDYVAFVGIDFPQ